MIVRSITDLSTIVVNHTFQFKSCFCYGTLDNNREILLDIKISTDSTLVGKIVAMAFLMFLELFFGVGGEFAIIIITFMWYTIMLL